MAGSDKLLTAVVAPVTNGPQVRDVDSPNRHRRLDVEACLVNTSRGAPDIPACDPVAKAACCADSCWLAYCCSQSIRLPPVNRHQRCMLNMPKLSAPRPPYSARVLLPSAAPRSPSQPRILPMIPPRPPPPLPPAPYSSAMACSCACSWARENSAALSPIPARL